MSDKGESSNGKRIKYSDDDQKETRDETEHKAGEQIPPLSPLIPPGLSAEDLSIFHMDFQRHGGGSLEDFVKQQQQAHWFQEQIHRSSTKTSFETSIKEYRPDPEGENEFDDFNSDSFGSDPDDEEGEQTELLIFEQEVSESDRFVIPYLSMFRYFPPLIFHPDTEATIQLTDHLRREWEVTLKYNKGLNAYVMTTGWTLYREDYDLNPPDLIQFYLPVPQLHRNHFFVKHKKRFGKSPPLFEVEVPRSNRLPISCELARDYFSPSEALLPPNHLREYPLRLTDYLNQTWEMRFLCFEDEQAYVIFRGWEQYVAQYSLRHKDMIRFYLQDPSPDENSFLIYHDLMPEPESDAPLPDDNEPPQFLRENLLCELSLSEADVGFGRMEMPGVEIPFLCRGREMIKLTDENNKNWYMIIVLVWKGYMIMDGWEGIVREHELKAGDMVRFYSPDGADHDKHFLIECVKKKKKKTEKEEVRRGLGNPGDSAALSQGGSRKGKEKL